MHDGILLGADVLARRELHAGVAAVERLGDCIDLQRHWCYPPQVALARAVVLVPGVALLGVGEVLIVLAREQLPAPLPRAPRVPHPHPAPAVRVTRRPRRPLKYFSKIN